MREINLSAGKVALVDDEDFDWLNQWKWSYSGHGYAEREVNGTKVYMHDFILGKYVDHENGDGLDNQRNNLRFSTVAQNGRNRGKNKNNSSGFKGVFKQTKSNSWIARIVVNRKPIYLGSFKKPELAHAAYVKAAKKYHGEFAHG